MAPESYLSTVSRIMLQFAVDTGLTGSQNPPDRYLWTDAFAVCNFLGLYESTHDGQYLQLALQLIDQVQSILGKHRKDDTRTGWISGLDEKEGQKHPTSGGLRIGKKLNERMPSEPFNERLEWDRDGQYFHYLTKWMHALNRTSRIMKEAKFNIWAIELARTVHRAFTYAPAEGGLKRMYWKMSIDLSHPLIPSMGQHDPLDGLITYLELEATSGSDIRNIFSLKKEIEEMSAICQDQQWITTDPLGLGGLLTDSYRIAQLIVEDFPEQLKLFKEILKSLPVGLEHYAHNKSLTLSAQYRLAFRELGLSIGLKSLDYLELLIKTHPDRFRENHNVYMKTEDMNRFKSLIPVIEKFWLDPVNQDSDTWNEHKNINTVMLATSLLPDGFLKI